MDKDFMTKALQTEPDFDIPQDFSASVLRKIQQREQASRWSALLWLAASISALVVCSVAGLYYAFGMDFFTMISPYLGWGALIILICIPIQLLDPMAKSKIHLEGN